MRDGDTAPTSSYIVCATPRSGSTLLCEYLMLTGDAGHPSEWFLPQGAALAAEMFGVGSSFEDPTYFAELSTKSKTQNGMFGVKMMWPQMEWLCKTILIERGSRLHDAGCFPNLKYIYITRDDEVEQAISLFMAVKTDVWQRFAIPRDGAEPSRWATAALKLDRSANATPRILTDDLHSQRWTLDQIKRELADPLQRKALLDEIARWRAEIAMQTAKWRGFFAQQEVSPFRVRYEALAAAPQDVMSAVLDFLGIDGSKLRLSSSRLRRLGDERNEALAAAYRATRTDLDKA